MTSLPSHANVSDSRNFLDEDEAESLGQALLSLFDEESEVPDTGLSTTSRLVTQESSQSTSTKSLKGPVNPSEVRRDKLELQPSDEVPRRGNPQADAEIDKVQDDLQTVLASPSFATEQFRVIGARDLISDEPSGACDKQRSTDAEPTGSSLASGVVFFDRPAAVGPGARLGVHLPNTPSSRSVADLMGATPSLLSEVPHRFDTARDETAAGKGSHSSYSGSPTPAGRGFNRGHLKNEISARGDSSGSSNSDVTTGNGYDSTLVGFERTVPSLGQRARKGVRRALAALDEGNKSAAETSAGGLKPTEEREFFSWFCPDRAAGSLRSGFDHDGSEMSGAAKASEAARRAQSPSSPAARISSVSSSHSNSPSVKLFLTETENVSGLRLPSCRKIPASAGPAPRLGSQFPEASRDLERTNSDAAAALTAVAVISIALVGWVAYAYVSDAADAPTNLEQASLAGPLVVRSATSAERPSTALSELSQASSPAVAFEEPKQQAVDRKVPSIAPVIAPLADVQSTLGLPIRHRSWAQFRLHRLDTSRHASDNRGQINNIFVIDMPKLESNPVLAEEGKSGSVVNAAHRFCELKPLATSEHRLPDAAAPFSRVPGFGGS